ncbi:DUF2281 domain-containing protein [Halomonas sp. JS92-SW72]|uniref:DUF2281 domain-containing protein n=1 Tax=Halomonas sp. JS92-SW72 TaxID=2306583 RepID=UPI000E5AF705|nr:DUF2281 domain-containing protein [Halomonas sp. JS92-SW72]AXY43648.1 DUF2281 domain-containing protein [Halomonas sp. JS92-SW72]
MQLEELITKVSRLPEVRQQEVMDFVTFLEQRYGQADPAEAEQLDWSEKQFRSMSIEQAMRDVEAEPDLYSEDDLNERWH